MKKIEHIGIAVSNLDKANDIYSNILGVGPYKNETVETEGVITSFFKCDNIKITAQLRVGIPVISYAN